MSNEIGEGLSPEPEEPTGQEIQRTLYRHLSQVQYFSDQVQLKKEEADERWRQSDLANAHATAALAIAVTLTGGDLEMALSRIATALEEK